MVHKTLAAMRNEAAVMLREDELAGLVELTIVSGIITVSGTGSRFSITVEGGQNAGNDTVTTILGMTQDKEYQFRPTYSDDTNKVTMDHGTGNIVCQNGRPFIMNHVNDRHFLENNGTYAIETGRSSNPAFT